MNRNDYHLLSEKDKYFIKINDEEKVHYGGNQQWFKNKRKKINGCGPVAGANVLAYLSLKDERYKGLYKKDNYSLDNYLEFMEAIYKEISPGPLGLININYFIKTILKYANSKNINLNYKKLDFRDKNFTYNSSYTFIRNALIRDIPVVVFNLDLRRNYLFSWHWMVITRVFLEKGNIKVVVSSWGRRYVIDFDRLYSSMKLGGGLVYFY